MNLDQPPGNDFRKGFMWTAAATAGFALLSLLGVAHGVFYLFWLAGAVGVLAALVAVLSLATAGKGSAVAGVVSGIAVGVLVLYVTCLTNVDMSQYP